MERNTKTETENVRDFCGRDELRTIPPTRKRHRQLFYVQNFFSDVFFLSLFFYRTKLFIY